jgi:ABC-type Fe3+/spermidine/putrescine transport system ATPase subunit
MSTVRLESVSKSYGEAEAVRDFNLEVADGEFVTLLGPSGCGKTTTLRMIAGLIPPSTGHIFFDDEEVTYLQARSRNVGFVFQTPALFPHLSVADNVAFGLAVKGVKKAVIKPRVDELLELVDLAGYGKRLPGQLSGGQQQRIALARVLATDPRVLLFDEPLSALDKNLRDRLKLSILELQRRTGKTAIYVTHDQSEAFAISDRIVVMNAGRAEQIGTQTDIYLNPQTKFVAEFIGANNAISGKVESVEGSAEAARMIVVGDGLRLRCPVRNDVGQGDAVLLYLRPEDLVVIGDDDERGYENAIDGVIDRIIFEGAIVQLWVNVGGRELRVDVAGGQRLSLTKRHGQVRLGVSNITVIPKPQIEVETNDEA